MSALISVGTVQVHLTHNVPSALITLLKITNHLRAVYVTPAGTVWVANITTLNPMQLLVDVIQSVWEDVWVLLPATAFAV